MTRRWKVGLVGAVVVLAAGVWGAVAFLGRGDSTFPGYARWVLERPEKMELFAVDPGPEGYSPNWPHVGRVGYFAVYGEVEIADAASREKLAAAIFEEAIPPGDTRESTHCFEPRHAIRVERGGRVATFVICFSCRQIWVEEGGQKQIVVIKGKARELFNEALASRGVRPVPESEKEDPTSRAAGSGPAARE